MAWIADDIFAAGGEQVTQDWAGFQAQAGALAVVLVSPGPLPALDAPRPWALLWLPVEAETEYALHHFQLGVDFVAAARAARQKVLLLGPRGLHHVRPLFAALLLSEGRSLARTLREVQQKPWLPPYRGEPALLEEWMTRIKPGK